MNVAFKHLEDSIRIGELTLWQWAWLVVGAMAAMVWGFYLSPLPALPTLLIAIYVVAMPAWAAVFAGFTEFDLVGLVAAFWRYRRTEGRYLPGAGQRAEGYLVLGEAEGARSAQAPATLELESLWDG